MRTGSSAVAAFCFQEDSCLLHCILWNVAITRVSNVASLLTYDTNELVKMCMPITHEVLQEDSAVFKG
jgi:hypothetical protein